MTGSPSAHRHHIRTDFSKQHLHPKHLPSQPALPTEILHDTHRCMFSIQLDHQGRSASLLYLPTSRQEVIEFYHTEIPAMYRYQGLGELLLYRAFQWAKEKKKYVIPTCPFIRKYLSLNFNIHHPPYHPTTACSTHHTNSHTKHPNNNNNNNNNNPSCVNKEQ
ncbi:GCN5-related N-acetyl-transferase-domain-containing protein [Sporodiniella umbellata]|nr:GCN5-related N-acetyl-transferase-domain-containing protein [Sporodiniella umbellata]